jgi:hypothetical protein
MKEISYTQIWGMAEWMEDQRDLVARAFYEVEPIQWMQEQGYTSHVARHYDRLTDNFHVKITFNIPDEIYTYVTLKWPEEVVKVDFNGPTIKEER